MKIAKFFITFKTITFDDVTVKLASPISKDDLAYYISMPDEKSGEGALRDFGLKLFQRLFIESALDYYRSSHPVAIALSVSDDLADVPWELLHDGTDWIARTRGLIRTARARRSVPEIIPKIGSLHVLAAISDPMLDESLHPDDPDQITPLDSSKYEKLFRKMDGEKIPLEIRLRERINRESLNYEMSESFQVLHFIGRSKAGRFVFETRHGSVDLVDEPWLREQLATGLRGNLRVLVVDSCHSLQDRGQVQELVSTALNTGIPIVIAMRDSISEPAAEVFIRSFYSSLAMGEAVDQSMLVARRSIVAEWQTLPYEWSSPMLFINDSLVDEPKSLMDAEALEMIAEPKVRISVPEQANLDNIMVRDQKFAGRRSELNEILQYLDPERLSGSQIVCLHGDPGIGKTSILLEAVRRTSEWFSEVKWLKINDGLSQSPIKQHFQGPKNKLMIFEDASNSVCDLINNMPPNCKAIITSDKPLGISGKLMHITRMKKHDSLALIAAYAKFDPDELNDLIHITGGHPMIIRLLLSQSSTAGKPLSNLLKDLRKAKTDMLDYVLDRSLKLALRDGRNLISAISVFYPTISRKALQEICMLSDNAFNNAINRLMQLSLVESYHGGKRLGLHPIVRTKAEELLAKNETDRYYDRAIEFFTEFAKATEPMTDLATASKALGFQMPAGTPEEQIEYAAKELIIKPALEMLESEIDNYLQLLRWASENGKISAAKPLLDSLGNILADYGYIDLVRHYYMAIIDELKDKGAKIVILYNLGMIYHKHGNSNDAISSYEEALKLSKTSGDRTVEAKILDRIGAVYNELQEWEESSRYYEELRDLYIENEPNKAMVLNTLGMLYQESGNSEKSIECLKNALEIYEKLGDRRGMADTLRNIGLYYHTIGQHEDASGMYQKSLDIYKDLDDKSYQGNIMNSLGRIFQEQDDIGRAMKFYQDSLAITHETGDKPAQRKALENIAILYSIQKKWTRAANACSESFLTAVQTSFSEVLDSLRNIMAICKIMLSSGEFATPAQIAYDISQLIQNSVVTNEELITSGLKLEMRAALTISQGVLTVIGFLAASEMDRSSNIYKEAFELATSLDKNTGEALNLSELFITDSVIS